MAARSRQAAHDIDTLIQAQCRDSDKVNKQRNSKSNSNGVGLIESLLRVTDRVGK